MLEGTSRDPGEIVCVMAPDLIECTVEKVAINGAEQRQRRRHGNEGGGMFGVYLMLIFGFLGYFMKKTEATRKTGIISA